MNKKKLILIILLLAISDSCILQGVSEKLMPQPVSVINWHDGMRVLNIKGIYLSMKPEKKEPNYSFSISGLGLTGDYNFAVNDKCGFNINYFVMGINSDSKDTYSKYVNDLTIWSINPNFSLELIGGEKKDIAGEITKSDFSMAAFIGLGRFSMGSSSYAQSNISGREKDTGSMDLIMKSWDLGAVAEIPLSFWISLAPSWYMTTYSSMEGKVFDQTIEEDGLSITMQMYGTDIFIRPLKLNPNLKVSLGMLFGLVESNSKDESGYKSTLIILGLQYEWGKHYSSVLVGPGITR
ncbi:MAG: hypothetical protein AB1349_11300 [Elusimicrobiota bacterium]